MEGYMATVRSRHSLFFLPGLILPLLFLFHVQVSADPLDNWHWRNPLPQGNSLRARFLNGNFIVMGGSGTIMTSKDGREWVSRNSGTKTSLYSAAFGNGLYTAVGQKGVILTSNDLVTWVPRLSGTTNDIHDVAFGNGIFVAITHANSVPGSPSAALISRDGVTWTKYESPTYRPLNKLTFGNGIFAGFGGDTLYRSMDGISWEFGRSTSADGSFADIAFGDGVFAAVGYWVGNFRLILLSSDGLTWTPNPWVQGSLKSVGFGKGMFVAGGITDVGATPPRCVVTFAPDGSALHTYDTGFPYMTFTSIAFGNDVFVATSGSAIFTSFDGQNWSLQTKGTVESVIGLAFGNSMFVAVTGRGGVLTSPDGTVWQQKSLPEGAYSVAYGKGKFVALDHNIVFTTVDGTAWTEKSFDFGVPITNVVFINNLFVALGQLKAIVLSEDGVNWRMVSSPSGVSGYTDYLTSAAFGNGKFVAVGSLGTVMTSSDGSVWTPSSVGTVTLNEVVFGNGIFVAVGFRSEDDLRQGVIMTSADGTTWTVRSFPEFSDLNTITFASGILLAAGNNGVVLTSPNGIDWSIRLSITNNAISACCFGNNTFVLTGNDGTIIQSDPLAQPQPSPDPAPSSDLPAPGGESDGGGGGGCFIATAAYGSYLHPHVIKLRQFRDKYLLANRIGTAFVQCYYRHSPPLALFIADRRYLRILTRWLLTPAVFGIEYPRLTGLLLLSLLLTGLAGRTGVIRSARHRAAHRGRRSVRTAGRNG
jgi:hypothetical protein